MLRFWDKKFDSNIFIVPKVKIPAHISFYDFLFWAKFDRTQRQSADSEILRF